MRIEALRAALGEAGRGVLVLVSEARGSTPREAGAAMLVTETGTLGTIGGGSAEHRAVAAARALLAPEPASRPAPSAEEQAGVRLGSPAASLIAPAATEAAVRAGSAEVSPAAAPPPGCALLDFALGPELDQCCGGRMTVALACLSARDADRLAAGGQLWPGGPRFEPEPEPRPALIYGAGHVGRALVAALAPLPFALRWIDARAGATADAPPGVETVETPLPEAEAAAAPPGAVHIVLTHSHALDLEICAAALSGAPAFVGLIGSATKRATFLRRLRARGLSEPALARLSCPIGLPGLRDKRPAVIAASVAAQLLQIDAAAEARGAA